jgi:hypothetical protein
LPTAKTVNGQNCLPIAKTANGRNPERRQEVCVDLRVDESQASGGDGEKKNLENISEHLKNRSRNLVLPSMRNFTFR